MLQVSNFVLRTSTSIRQQRRLQLLPRLGRYLLLLILAGCLTDSLSGHVCPLLGVPHNRLGIHETVAKFVAHFTIDAVGGPALLVAKWFVTRRDDRQMLHISPGQLRIRLQR